MLKNTIERILRKTVSYVPTVPNFSHCTAKQMLTERGEEDGASISPGGETNMRELPGT